MDIFDPTEIEKAVGATLMVRGVALKVLSRAKCEYAPDMDSTYYNVETPEGTTALLNAHTVHGLLAGTTVLDPIEPKEPSKREKAGLLVKELQEAGLSSGEIIKRLQADLELGKTTATTYYYSMRS